MDRFFSLVQKTTSCCKWSKIWLGPGFVGCPPGHILGPLLFSLYINDISSDLESEIRLFADDYVCYREIKDEGDTMELQKDIDRLGSWQGSGVCDFNLSNAIWIKKIHEKIKKIHKKIKKIHKIKKIIARPWVGRQTQWWPRHKAIYFSCFGPELFCLLLGRPGFNCWFSFAPVFQWCCSTPQGSPGVGRNTFLSSPHLCFIIVFTCDLFPVIIHWWVRKPSRGPNNCMFWAMREAEGEVGYP